MIKTSFYIAPKVKVAPLFMNQILCASEINTDETEDFEEGEVYEGVL